MIENDAVNVTAYVRIYKDPTGVLWHNFIKSVTPRDFLSIFANQSKLQLQERNWHGGSEESRSNVLPQLTTSIVVFHERFP